MRRKAGLIGRPPVLFAAIIALCCLTGCEAFQDWQNLDHDEATPAKWMNGGGDKDELDAYKDLSLSGARNEPALAFRFAAVRPAG